MADIQHYLAIKATPQAVFEAITTQQGLAEWWTEQVIAKPELSSIADFRFGELYHNQMRITKLEPLKLVEWVCILGHEEWLDTLIEFRIEALPEKTILRFAHKNWEETSDFFGSCNFNWGFYLNSLKQYCETGKGTPFVVK